MNIERIKYRIIALWMVMLSLFAFHLSSLSAQNLTSSPYSRYAYGDLNENVPAAYRAMGGVGLGMRSNRAINPSQPASFTACDTLTFMMDIAASATWSRYQDASGMRNKANGNLEYLTFQIPLWKQWIAMSFGLIPYSSVGYSISIKDSTAGGAYHYTTDYEGVGNISEVYAGLSFNICNYFAIGANFYYMWGSLQRIRALAFEETGLQPSLQDELMLVRTPRLRFGAQFFHTWGDHTINAGAIFEPKMKMNCDVIVIETQSEDSIPIIEGLWELPMVWGVGASYTWANRLTVAFDFERQCMGSAMYNGYLGSDSRNGLRDRDRMAIGVEYQHNPLGRKYVDRMRWRAGVSVQDEYLASIGAKRITAGIGIGFPVYGVGTMVNTTLEYSHRGSPAGLEENNLRLTVGISVAENWFFKRKL